MDKNQKGTYKVKYLINGGRPGGGGGDRGRPGEECSFRGVSMSPGSRAMSGVA